MLVAKATFSAFCSSAKNMLTYPFKWLVQKAITYFSLVVTAIPLAMLMASPTMVDLASSIFLDRSLLVLEMVE